MSLCAAAEEILATFDFEKVKKAIDATGSVWFLDGEYRAPTLEEIRERARRLLALRMMTPTEAYGIDDQNLVVRIRNGILSLSYFVDVKEVALDLE